MGEFFTMLPNLENLIQRECARLEACVHVGVPGSTIPRIQSNL
jgi:hypothetical protein